MAHEIPVKSRLDKASTHNTIGCARDYELPKRVWGDGWTVTDLLAPPGEWAHVLEVYEDGSGAAPKDAVPGLQMERDAKAEPGHLGEHRFRSAGAIRADFAPVSRVGF